MEPFRDEPFKIDIFTYILFASEEKEAILKGELTPFESHQKMMWITNTLKVLHKRNRIQFKSNLVRAKTHPTEKP